MTPLLPGEIDAFVAGSSLWRREGDALAARLLFPDFKVAMAFLVALAFEAEAAGHHPEIHNVYNRVSLRLTTHDAGGAVTERDVGLARTVEVLAAGFRPA